MDTSVSTSTASVDIVSALPSIQSVVSLSDLVSGSGLSSLSSEAVAALAASITATQSGGTTGDAKSLPVKESASSSVADAASKGGGILVQ